MADDSFHARRPAAPSKAPQPGFYLNPAYILRQAAKIGSVKEPVYYAKATTTLISWIHSVDLAAKAPDIDWDDTGYVPAGSTAPQAQVMAQAS